MRENYFGKISGPLLDRIAIHVTVRPVDVEAWSGRADPCSVIVLDCGPRSTEDR